MTKYLLISISFLTMFSMFSFSDVPLYDYNKKWKEVAKFEKERLPKSALALVEEIYLQAERENNKIQIVKTTLHKVKFTLQLSEEGFSKSVAIFDQEIQKHQGYAKNLLYSAQATLYHNYLNSHLYQINQRTTISGAPDTDPTTWPVATFLEKISHSYQASIANPSENKSGIEDFKEILNNYDKSYKPYLPTLQDLLVSRALQFYATNQSYLPRPSYSFGIDNANFLLDQKSFANHIFETSDTSSLLYKAIRVFQKHLKTLPVNSVVGAERNLNRLDLVYRQGNFEDKNAIYLERLVHLEKEYTDLPQYTEVLYRLAQFHFNKGTQENSGRINPDSWKKALSYCNKAITHDKNAFGTGQCMSIYNRINSQELQVQAEKNYTIGEHALIRIDYKNIKQVFFHLYELSDQEYNDYQKTNGKDRVKYFDKREAVKQWNEKLPMDGSYYQQSAELSIGAQRSGRWAIVFSDHEDYSTSGSISSVAFFDVTNIAYSFQNYNNQSKIYAVNRISGHGIAGAKVKGYTNQYNRQNRSNHLIQVFEGTTDEAGLFDIPSDISSQFQLRISHDTDVFYSTNWHYNRKEGSRNQANKNSVVFTDRSIYRPGQVIYFKALALQYNEDGIPQIRPNEKLEIEFRDANGQKVGDRVNLTTNEFGSCNGSFNAPMTGLMGQMSITVLSDNSSQYFNVEEYKRPKFEVKIDPLEVSYVLNDSVELTVHATSYAGAPLDNAHLNFSVKRRAFFPYYRYSRFRGYNPNAYQNDMQIEHGKLSLDNEGKATISFKAIGDKTIKSAWKPFYSYTIDVEVVDINGEVQSSQSSISIGAQSRTVNLQLEEKEQANKIDSAAIVIKDLNGRVQDGEGVISIFQLKEPANVTNKRYWTLPDTSLVNVRNYNMDHPWYSQEEKGLEYLEIGKLVKEIKFDTQKDRQVNLHKVLQSGSYRIEVKLKEKDGSEIEHEQFLTVYDHDENHYSTTAPLFYDLDKTSYQPGEKVNFSLGSSFEDLAILYVLEKNGILVDQKWINTKNGQDIIIPVEEKDRGGFDVHLLYFKNNRFYKEQIKIKVPWSNKDLNISFETFRDKLLPGSKEQFRIKISGPKKDKVAAEFLAGMYDASLDAFKPHNWNHSFYRNRHGRFYTAVNGYQSSFSQNFYNHRYINERWKTDQKRLPSLQLWGETYNFFRGIRDMAYAEGDYGDGIRFRSKRMSAAPGGFESAPQMMNESEAMDADIMSDSANLSAVSITSDGSELLNQSQETKAKDEIPIRKNLKETVFFFPDLKTDVNGDVLLNFTMNEALAKWKLMSFAHTQDLKFAFDTRELLTQKELMVIPNIPRFVRDHDRIKLEAKINNLTEESLSGVAQLQFFDALTNKPVSVDVELLETNKHFTVDSKGSTVVNWWIQLPDRSIDALLYRITARANKHSDGEEGILPVITNKVFVTETKQLTAPGKETTAYRFERFTDNSSTSLVHKNFALEYTSNPAWYAIQALPYIMEYPHQCTEQVLNRFYANALASHISNQHPRIKAVFDDWRRKDSDALVSNLEKNQELKSALLEETPWLVNGLSESQQKKRIALLFDLNKMSQEKASLMALIKARINPDGGYSWFAGGKSDRFISQYVLENLGHLMKLGALEGINPDNEQWLSQLLDYVDYELKKEYDNLKEKKGDHLSYIASHYLYTRSFYKRPINRDCQKAFDYYIDQAKEYGLNRGIYLNGLTALSLHRYGHKSAAKKIYNSLIERSIVHPELGRYWNEGNGYVWYELPIERHALMIEMVSELGENETYEEELKIWLLRNKQTNHWKTTKATSAAIYALLIEGESGGMSSWITDSSPPTIKVNNEVIDVSNAESGTGYVKTSWSEKGIVNGLGEISITNNNEHTGWGGAYWSYFEDMDKVTSFEETPLKLKKELFKVTHNDLEETMEVLEDDASLEIGDKVRIRILLESDRTMEYLHLKDMRASGLEPISVLSGNQYSHGLYYYQSTRDLATDFFIHRLGKGKYVFEYDLKVQHAGNFSNGITTIQSMYAPEFTSHSKGVKIKVLD